MFTHEKAPPIPLRNLENSDKRAITGRFSVGGWYPIGGSPSTTLPYPKSSLIFRTSVPFTKLALASLKYSLFAAAYSPAQEQPVTNSLLYSIVPS